MSFIRNNLTTTADFRSGQRSKIRTTYRRFLLRSKLLQPSDQSKPPEPTQSANGEPHSGAPFWSQLACD